MEALTDLESSAGSGTGVASAGYDEASGWDDEEDEFMLGAHHTSPERTSDQSRYEADPFCVEYKHTNILFTPIVWNHLFISIRLNINFF